MPSISFGEILLILLVVIIFVKPEELPRFMRGVAKIYRSVQRTFFRVRNVTHDALREVSSVGLEEEWRQNAKAAPTMLPPAASVAQVAGGGEAPKPATAGEAAQPAPAANSAATPGTGTGTPSATSAPAKPAVTVAPPADGPVPRG